MKSADEKGRLSKEASRGIRGSYVPPVTRVMKSPKSHWKSVLRSLYFLVSEINQPIVWRCQSHVLEEVLSSPYILTCWLYLDLYLNTVAIFARSPLTLILSSSSLVAHSS